MESVGITKYKLIAKGHALKNKTIHFRNMQTCSCTFKLGMQWYITVKKV